MSEETTALTPTITEKDAMLAIVILISYCESTCYELISSHCYIFFKVQCTHAYILYITTYVRIMHLCNFTCPNFLLFKAAHSDTTLRQRYSHCTNHCQKHALSQHHNHCLNNAVIGMPLSECHSIGSPYIYIHKYRHTYIFQFHSTFTHNPSSL